MFQAAQLVQQLAHDGRAGTRAFASSIQSILKLNANTTEEVFGGVRGVRDGLELVQSRLAGGDEPLDVEIARYVISMLHMAGVLTRRDDVQEAIRHDIETAETQMKFFEPTDGGVHPTLIEKLAEVYVQHLSTLAPRIMVTGEHGYLVNPLIAAKVRAALLAGIRAAFLWRQLGGRRWQLLFSRRKMALAAARLLDERRR